MGIYKGELAAGQRDSPEGMAIAKSAVCEQRNYHYSFKSIRNFDFENELDDIAPVIREISSCAKASFAHPTLLINMARFWPGTKKRPSIIA